MKTMNENDNVRMMCLEKQNMKCDLAVHPLYGSLSSAHSRQVHLRLCDFILLAIENLERSSSF